MAEIQTVAFFLHIPRTGGTTIRIVAEQNEEMGHILPIYGPDIEHPEWVIQRLHEPTRLALKLIRGHIPYGLHRHIYWAQCLYFSILRDPVERVWSLWNYAKRNRAHHLYEELNKLGTLRDALESGVSTEFNNGMCRQLSGIDGPFPQKPYAQTNFDYGDCTDIIDAVMDHLDSYHIAVGCTEYFDDFLEMMCATLGWENRQHGVENAGPKRQPGDLDEDTIRLIHELNAGDVRIWDFARGMSE